MEALTYLAFIAAWFGPVFALEWAFGWRTLRDQWRPLAAAVAMATAYLGFADVTAIRNGIWDLSPAKTLGLRGGGFVIEEWLLLLLTNAIIAQAVVLALDEPTRRRVGRLIGRR